jgi:hypothetical protein
MRLAFINLLSPALAAEPHAAAARTKEIYNNSCMVYSDNLPRADLVSV